jgi:mediator of RNA polymerase II transcription subunit 13
MLMCHAVWSSLSASTNQLTIITVVMGIDADPPLAVFPKQAPPAPQSINTPIDTPGVSPDQTALTPAATPSSSEPNLDLASDPDAHLVDVGDETWGLILAHRTNVSGSLTEYRPSLSTGYLLRKNNGPGIPLDTPTDAALQGYGLAAVHLLWIGTSPRAPSQSSSNQNQAQNQNQNQSQNQNSTGQNVPSSSPTDPPATPTIVPASNNSNALPKATSDSILRDYLSIYRGLGTLARARGLEGTRRGLLPWHVVVALRGVRGLERVYGGSL